MTRPPLVRIDRASKVFRSGDNDVIALDHVSLDIHEGEVLGILGPSGSGKTTLLMLAGLVEAPTSGLIQFYPDVSVGPGAQLHALTQLRRRKIGFVFQRANLIPFLTALENVQIAMQLDGKTVEDARARAMSLLADLGVAHRAGNLPRRLSGGEQQRVAIARALSNRPAIIFADEPTAALDSGRGRVVMELFRRLAREDGVAVVIVTHDPRAVQFVDRVVEMADGRITRSYVNDAAAVA